MSDSIVGTRIGIFDVLYECDYKANDGHKLYHVKCIECGFETDIQKSGIARPKVCLHVGINQERRHFDYVWQNHRIGSIFNGMKKRCYNQNDKSYKVYGGRGIRVCDEWMKNPKSFEEWALANGYADNLTINRKNENKNYCPENCEWITGKDNSKYKSTTSLINVDGETHTGREWAAVLGLGTNIINTYVRTYGLDNTIEFIRRYKINPNLKPEGTQSYYSLYMNQEITKSEENL